MSFSAVSEVRGSTLLPVALQAGGLDNSSGRSSTTVLEYRLHRFCNRGYKYSVITVSKIFISVSTWTIEGEGDEKAWSQITIFGFGRIYIYISHSFLGTIFQWHVHYFDNSSSVIGPNRPISLLSITVEQPLCCLPLLCVQFETI